MSFGVLGQDLFGARHLLCDDTLGLSVYQLRRAVRIGLGEAVVIASRGVIEADIFQFVAHTIVRHHGVRLLGSTLQVVECTGGSLVEEQLLCSTPSQE